MDSSLIIDLALVAIVAVLWLGARKQAAQAKRSREVEMLDPGKLLFSLPTIADGVPPVVPGSESPDERSAPTLHEDDWRQIEFRAAGDRARIAEQLAAIRAHVDINRVGIGFREVFVRPDPPEPIAGGEITIPDVARELGASGATPVYLHGGGRALAVAGGFAVDVPGVGFVYGAEYDGRAGTLGLAIVDRHPERGQLDLLARLCDRFDLILVDWLRQEIVDCRDVEGLREWLATFGHDDAPGDADPDRD